MASDLAASKNVSTKLGTESSHQSRHIGIIGAGVAGLRCAEVLLEHGIKVTILEGRNRVGGRLAQATVTGHTVDLGPNWIHGTKDNPVYELVKSTQTTTSSFEEVPVIIDSDKTRIDDTLAAQLSNIFWEIVGKATEYSAKHITDNTISKDQSLLDYVETYAPIFVKAAFPKANKKETTRLIELVIHIGDVWGLYIGSKISAQSLKYLWLEECLDGENLFCAGTYSKVLEAVSEAALQKAEIQYDTVVIKIKDKEQQASRKVLVETMEGDVYEFDDIVMTAPLGWLKHNTAVFEPPIPENISQAINNLGYGMLDKVYITFPVAFWLPHASVTSFLRPEYIPESPLAGISQEAITLSSLPGSDAHPTLLFYIADPTSDIISKHLSNSLTPNTPAIEANSLLPIFFPYVSQLPNYNSNNPDCQPQSILATNWRADPLAGYGSYTFFPAGVDTCDKHVEALREGMPERGIYLAGEHTAPFVALGTVTGAWMSGDVVARRILAGSNL